jgi:hypothetical protein
MHQPVRIHDSDGNPIKTANPLAVTVTAQAAPASLPLPTGAALESSLSAINAKGFYRIVKEIVRPTDTTPYSANDCLGAAAPGPTTQNLPLAGRVVGGSGAIVRAVMKTDNLSWTAAVYVVVYDLAVPASWIADNAAFDPKYADSDNIVGVIQFNSFAKDASGAAGSFVKSNGVLSDASLPYRCAADSQNLYFQCFVTGTPTPANAQKFKLNVGVVRD